MGTGWPTSLFAHPLPRPSPILAPWACSESNCSSVVSSISKDDGTVGAGVLSAAHERINPGITSPAESYTQRFLPDGGGASADVHALRGEVRVLSSSVAELAGAMKEGQQGLLDAIAALGKRLDERPALAAAE